MPSIADLMSNLQEEQEEWDEVLERILPTILQNKGSLPKKFAGRKSPSMLEKEKEDPRLKDLDPSDPYYNDLLRILPHYPNATVERMREILKDLT